MKPPPFDFVRAETADHALDLLQSHGDDAKLLAGGQSLMPLLNYRLARPSTLIDINKVPNMADITVDTTAGHVRVGGLTRHHRLETSSTLRTHFPLIGEAASWIAHPQIRTRGTIGGSLAHCDASAEIPVVMLALDATVNIRTHTSERTLPIEELVVGHFISSLDWNEMITGVDIPLLPEGTGTAFTEFARRHGDYAIGGAAAVITLDDNGTCTRARITVLGGGTTTLRCTDIENVLLGNTLDTTLVNTAAHDGVGHLTPMSNLHGDSEYKRRVIASMIKRAINTATDRARSAR